MRPLRLTLVGAYHPFSAPFASRGLVVSLALSRAVWNGATGQAVLDAEALAESAQATFTFRPSRDGAHFRFEFLGGSLLSLHVLSVVQELRRPTLRSLTELSGMIGPALAAPLGAVRLRWDFRGGALRGNL